MENQSQHSQPQIINNSYSSQPLQASMPQKQQSAQQINNQAQQSTDINDHHSQISHEQQIPEHFYDSDMASVCQKDFQSDNQPPKDIVQQRKLLYKQKLLHVFKTIIRVGSGIDKPARYDRIKIKQREVSKQEIKLYKRDDKNKQKEKQQKQSNIQSKPKQQENRANNQITQKKTQQISQQIPQPKQLPPFYSTSYLQQCPQIQYNVGNQRQQIERLVTSMKRGQTALFELQHLTVSKKSNIKIKQKTQIHVIQTFDWTTVIDLDCDKRYLKYVLTKGQGAFRVALHDKITFNYSIKRGNIQIHNKQFQSQRLQKQFIENQLPNIIWRVLTSMKDKQCVKLQILDEDMIQMQGQHYQDLLKIYNQAKSLLNQQQKLNQNQNNWKVKIQIQSLVKVDDIYLDGRILKQTLVKGVSTAKPQSSSLIFYALKFIDNDQKQLKVDSCFNSDWWQDFGVLDQLQGIRKNHLDDYSISKFLRKAIKRMKPAQIAIIQCRDKQLFQYGSDYNQLKELLKFTQTPQVVKMIVRIYNFTQAKNAFNMEIQQKIVESKRKKQIAIKLLSQNKLQKALKRFQNIIAFYSSQKINQQAYDQKVSALMNAILCHMKMKKYTEMINLCNQILLKPRHGHQFKDLKIVGPGHAKIQGSLNKPQNDEDGQVQPVEGDTRRIAVDLVQNQKILDKCLYRKAFALVQLGQCEQALKSINQISKQMSSSQQVQKLKVQAEKGKTKYEQKSKKIFKSMFG